MQSKREHLIRSSDLIPEAITSTRINVIGVGAVGSELVITLGKMGFDNIHVWDTDEVAIENVGCQFYGFNDIGLKKVDAINAHSENLCGSSLTLNQSYYERGTLPGITVVAVDNMLTRKRVFMEHTGLAPYTRLVIDPRMGAEHAAVYTYVPMDLDSCQSYSKSLYSDDAGLQEPCTAKATSYCSKAIASIVASTIKSFLTGSDYAKNVQYSIPSLDMTTFMREGTNKHGKEKSIKEKSSKEENDLLNVI